LHRLCSHVNARKVHSHADCALAPSRCSHPCVERSTEGINQYREQSQNKNGISNGSFSEVHLTLKSYCFSAFLPEVWHSVAHHDLICEIRILGKKWGKSALHGEKTGKIFNTNQPILKPGPARQAPIYCGYSDVVAERFFAAYYLPLIPTDLKTLKYSIFSLFFNSIGENMGNKSTQKNS